MTRMKRTGEGPCPCLLVSLLLRLGLLLCRPALLLRPGGGGHLTVLSAWRREERSLESLGERFVPSGGAHPRIYDPNLYRAHHGSKCLPRCCVQSAGGCTEGIPSVNKAAVSNPPLSGSCRHPCALTQCWARNPSRLGSELRFSAALKTS